MKIRIGLPAVGAVAALLAFGCSQADRAPSAVVVTPLRDVTGEVNHVPLAICEGGLRHLWQFFSPPGTEVAFSEAGPSPDVLVIAPSLVPGEGGGTLLRVTAGIGGRERLLSESAIDLTSLQTVLVSARDALSRVREAAVEAGWLIPPGTGPAGGEGEGWEVSPPETVELAELLDGLDRLSARLRLYPYDPAAWFTAARYLEQLRLSSRNSSTFWRGLDSRAAALWAVGAGLDPSSAEAGLGLAALLYRFENSRDAHPLAVEAARALPDSRFARMLPDLITGDCRALRGWGEMPDLPPVLAAELLSVYDYTKMEQLAFAQLAARRERSPDLLMWDFLSAWHGSVGPARAATGRLLERAPGVVIELLLGGGRGFVPEDLRASHQPLLESVRQRARPGPSAGVGCVLSDPFGDLDRALALLAEIGEALPGGAAEAANILSPEETLEILRVWLRGAFRDRFNLLSRRLGDYRASGAFLAELEERFPGCVEVAEDRFINCYGTGDRAGQRAATEEILAAAGNEMILVKYAKQLLWAAGGKARRKEILDRLARWFQYIPPGRGTVGIYFYHQGEQARSQELLREMLEAAPYNAQVRLYIAYGLEDPEEVHRLFREGEEFLAESYQYHSCVGEYYKKTGDRERAIAYYLRAAEIFPEASAVRRELADLYLESSEPDLAIAQLREHLKYDTRSLSAISMRDRIGNIYLNQERYPEAYEIFRQTAGSYKASSLIGMARACQGLERYEEAEEWFKRAERRYPTGSCVIALARFYHNRGRFQERDELLLRHAEAGMKQSLKTEVRKFYLEEAGEPARALEIFQGIPDGDLSPEDARSLAEIHEALEDYPGAVEWWEACVELENRMGTAQGEEKAEKRLAEARERLREGETE